MCLPLLAMGIQFRYLSFHLYTDLATSTNFNYMCASSGPHYFAWCRYLAAFDGLVAMLLPLLAFSYVSLFLCYVFSSHTDSVWFTLFALYFESVLPAPLLDCIGDMTGICSSCLFSSSAAYFRSSRLSCCGIRHTLSFPYYPFSLASYSLPGS